MKLNIVVKVILGTVFGLAAIFYLVLFGGSTYEAVVFPQSPQKVTLAQAVEMGLQNKPEFLFFDKALYVSITDPVWECASVKQVDASNNSDDRTEGVISNGNKDALIFVQVHGLYTCQELQKMAVAGKLQRYTKRPVEYASDANGIVRIDESSEAKTFELITHGTPSEARLYPVFFLGLPFVIWGMFVYGRCQREQGVV